MDELIESLEAQIIDLYREKEEIIAGTGLLDTDSIIDEFSRLEAELVALYEFKEHYTRIDAKQITIDSIQSVYIPKERLRKG